MAGEAITDQTTNPAGHAAPPRQPTLAQCRDLVGKLTVSRTFQKSVRQREILLYLCERVLSDPKVAIREQDIGAAVCGRSLEYDTGQDNIVRVHVSELRRRLDKYFEDEGVAETCTLTIPKGSYVPVFTLRPVTAPALEPIPEVASPVTPPPPVPFFRRWQTAYGLCVLLAVVFAWYAIQNHSPSAATSAPNLLWAKLLVSGQTTDVVLADSNLSLLQDLTGQDVSLNEYLNHQYWKSPAADVWTAAQKHEFDTLMTRRYTSISDADFVRRVMSVPTAASTSVNVAFARDYTLRELQSDNVILVGSPRSNPWAELFQNRLNFQFEVDPHTRLPRYRVRRPQPAQPDLFALDNGQASDYDAYGALAFLPNASHTRHVLLLSGTGIHAIRAGAEFVTSDRLLTTLAGWTHRPGTLPYFEILYRTHRIGGAARDFEIVSYQIHLE